MDEHDELVGAPSGPMLPRPLPRGGGVAIASSSPLVAETLALALGQLLHVPVAVYANLGEAAGFGRDDPAVDPVELTLDPYAIGPGAAAAVAAPVVVVLDEPRGDSYLGRLADQCHQWWPGARLLLLRRAGVPVSGKPATRPGVAGWIHGRSTLEDLAGAIVAAHRATSSRLMPPRRETGAGRVGAAGRGSVARRESAASWERVTGRGSAAVSHRARTAGGIEYLTERERDVLKLLANGMAGEEVSRVLGISPNTVRTHVQNLMAKLGVSSRLEAVSMAHLAGLVGVGVAPPADKAHSLE